jgi:hypothetical protein
MEKITLDKGSVCRIYKELKNLNIKRTIELINGQMTEYIGNLKN